ncbi:hypothetical protein YC2023_111822 [Brassica napus]
MNQHFKIIKTVLTYQDSAESNQLCRVTTLLKAIVRKKERTNGSSLSATTDLRVMSPNPHAKSNR